MRGHPLSKPKPNQHVILWDIDGTLVNARASRADKHVAAVEIFLGRDVPTQERTAGKTDQQILCELLEGQGTESSPAIMTKVLGILDALSIKEINEYPVLCNPGVTNALKMASSAGWINGLLTGNTPVRARAKLESACIWEMFSTKFAYFGHDAPTRAKLVASGAVAMGSARCSVAIVIGDTPLDIRSAQEHKLRVVAVSTGPYSAEELRGWDPDLVLSDWRSGLVSLLGFLNSVHA
jgi:phosphoglycolate phosphatase-like HAD superfamily hydrolase